ncbi:MAG: DUF255 domain-containing protein, partial [Fimbriimonas ginsengisoli]|nr:DUF255 domain-containing protein [Fimbriimonas ginsengisoli]
MTFRPAFAVTAAVVGVLALAGLAARILQPAIPPPKLNRLGAEASESLRAAAGQRIDWRTASPEAFAEARRLDRPILLMIAASWCKAARDLDHECLSGSQIQNYLDRSFLCIRVDGQDRPDWLNAFLPVSRLRLDVPFEVGMQIWILDPEGKPFDFIGRVPGEPKFDRRELLARLVQARRGFEELRASPGVPSKLAQAQATDQAESEPGEMKQAAVVAALDALEGKI